MDNVPHLPEIHNRPWDLLSGVDDAEVWVANSNLELQFFCEQDKKAGLPMGQGVCFTLALGGELFLHTTSEGMIFLDVTGEAEWVTPIVASCTGAKPAKGQIWVLPEGTLIQLLLGLNSLIATSRIVLQHNFGMHF